MTAVRGDAPSCVYCGSPKVRATRRTVVVGYRQSGHRRRAVRDKRDGMHCAACGGWEETGG